MLAVFSVLSVLSVVQELFALDAVTLNRLLKSVDDFLSLASFRSEARNLLLAIG